MTAVDELVRAWSRWERHPAGYDAATDMETSSALVAVEVGTTATVLRARLADARRALNLDDGAACTSGDLARCVRHALDQLAPGAAA